MSKKCECKHCAVHIEFEEENLGQTVPCPNCGKDVVLTIPKPKAPVPPPPATTVDKPKFMESTPYLACLAQVRATTCYKALRNVLNIAFNTTKGFTALCAVLIVLALFLLPMPALQGPPPADASAAASGLATTTLAPATPAAAPALATWVKIVFRLLAAVVWSCFAFLVLATIHAAHHLAMVLVDMADCHIRLVAAGSSPRPTETARGASPATRMQP